MTEDHEASAVSQLPIAWSRDRIKKTACSDRAGGRTGQNKVRSGPSRVTTDIA